MLWEISEGRRVKPPSEIYRPGDLLPYTLRIISRKCALLLGQCSRGQRHGHTSVRWEGSELTGLPRGMEEV
jgi:hypothetical protein